MGYIESNLSSGEVVEKRAQNHWMYFATFKNICLFLYILFYLLAPSVTSPAARGLAIVCLVWLAISLLSIRAREMVITNKRVVMKWGLLSRKVHELVLNKIETVNVDQSILGRVFGYGTLVIVGSGGTKTPFQYVSDPFEFRKGLKML